MARQPSITAFFPCYNDSGTIASVVITADRTLRELTDDYEIIVANDASTDNSAEILEELRHLYPRLRVMHHATNHGYGGNLRSMFAEATKDLIFYTDGDAQYDPSELSRLYARLEPNVDVVQGWKIERHDPLHRKIIGRIYHHFVRWWFGLHLQDVDCDFRLFRRHVLESFPLVSNSGCITVEMMTRVEQGGFHVVEVPVHHYFRAYGQSQFFNFGRVARTLVELSELWIKLKLLPRRDVSGAATPPRAAR
ncbi:MAG TPA: glycosyltransferase family 2 protein [Chloroflexota bacterium]